MTTSRRRGFGLYLRASQWRLAGAWDTAPSGRRRVAEHSAPELAGAPHPGGPPQPAALPYSPGLAISAGQRAVRAQRCSWSPGPAGGRGTPRGPSDRQIRGTAWVAAELHQPVSYTHLRAHETDSY